MSDDATELRAQPPTDVAYELATRLTALESKVETQKNSIWARSGTIAGVFGLLLSIINGGFTLFDQLFWKPDEEKAAEYNSFKTDVRLLISVDEELVKSINSATADYSIAYSNQKKQSILQDVQRLLSLIGESAKRKGGKYFIGSYDYNILSQAAYQGGNLQSALSFADWAVTAADNLHTKSEALRSKAVMIMQVHGSSGAADAESALAEAEQALMEAKGNDMLASAVTYDRTLLYVTRTMIALGAGKCTDAAEHSKRALDLVSQSNDPLLRSAYTQIQKQLLSGIQQWQNCPIYLFPETLQNKSNLAPAQPTSTVPALAGGPSGSGFLQSRAATPAPTPGAWPARKAK